MMFNQHNLDIAKITPKEQSRPEINSVFFKPDKTVATDSFRLIEMAVPKTTEEDINNYPAKSMRGFKPFLIDAHTLKSVKIKPNKNLPVLQYATVKHVDNNKVELNIPAAGDGAAGVTEVKAFRRVDGQFPDYEQIMPKGAPVIEVMVNGRYLKELLELLVKSNAGKDEKVTVKLYGEKEPIVITNNNEDQKGTAVLMPIQR